MWVDAVCINQADDNEKSAQVAMMDTIYTNCQKTVIWLGECSYSTPPDVRESSSPPVSRYAQSAFKFLRIFEQDEHLDIHGISDRLELHLATKPYWYSIIGLDPLLTPWWNRVWIIQEMALPTEIEFAFASETCPYVAPYRFYQHLTTCCATTRRSLLSNERLSELEHGTKLMIERLEPLIRIRQSIRENGKISFSKLIKTLSNFKATDPRDLVYGILGMVTNWGTVAPLIPDYKQSLCTVICEAIVKIIQQDKSLSVLRDSRWAFPMDMSMSDNMGSFPKWILESISFRSSLDGPSWTQEDIAQHPTTFHLSKVACSTAELINGSILRIRSLKLDVIDSLAKIDTADQLTLILQAMKMCGPFRWPKEAPAEMMTEVPSWHAVINDAVQLNYSDQNLSRPTLDDYNSAERLFSTISSTRQLFSNETQPPALRNRGCTLFFTAAGNVGIGSFRCKRNDEIHVVPGFGAPRILRPVSQQEIEGLTRDSSPSHQSSYEIMGDGYVPGIMDGEVLQDVNIDEIPLIDLI